MADDQGRLCAREAFDSSTGCCSAAAKQHVCDTCVAPPAAGRRPSSAPTSKPCEPLADKSFSATCVVCRCDPADECCSSYEHCVSCCMAPGSKAEERRLTTPRGLNKCAAP